MADKNSGARQPDTATGADSAPADAPEKLPIQEHPVELHSPDSETASNDDS